MKYAALDGKPLVDLPNKTVDTKSLKLSHEERQIYESIQSNAQVKFSRFLKAGTVSRAPVLLTCADISLCAGHEGTFQNSPICLPLSFISLQNYAHVLVLLLRLRQVCNHPALVCEDPHDAAIAKLEDEKEARQQEVQRARELIGDEKVDKILKRLFDQGQSLVIVMDSGSSLSK